MNICNWCDQPNNTNNKYCSRSCSAKYARSKRKNCAHNKYDELAEKARIIREKKIKKYNSKPKICLNCDSPINFKNKAGKFCGYSCSAKYNNIIHKNKTVPTDIKNKRRDGLIKHLIMTGTLQTEIDRLCIECGGKYKTLSSNTNRKFCSCKCAGKNRIKNNSKRMTGKKRYQYDCKFRFNLKDFSDKFSFVLIEQHGWYKAKNNGDNPTGISRDHMYSIKDGFDNNVDPYLISHPANCQLMQHTINWNKRGNSSIPIEELKKRVEEWDNKNPK